MHVCVFSLKVWLNAEICICGQNKLIKYYFPTLTKQIQLDVLIPGCSDVRKVVWLKEADCTCTVRLWESRSIPPSSSVISLVIEPEHLDLTVFSLSWCLTGLGSFSHFSLLRSRLWRVCFLFLRHQLRSHSSLMPCSQATLACSSLVAAIMGCEILRGIGRGAGGGGADWACRGSSSGMHPSLR